MFNASWSPPAGPLGHLVGAGRQDLADLSLPLLRGWLAAQRGAGLSRATMARHLFRATEQERAESHRLWTPQDGPLPSLYLSHGAPMLFEMTGCMTELHDWARALPKPKAILIVSAHWESAPVSISATRPTELVYDFGGFDPLYKTMRYDTPDATELAKQVESVLPDAEHVHTHPTRGLDHGAWVPLRIMYPDADIPVLQLSMPTHEPARLLALGERLRALRDEGVLVIGSGYMTHGLPYIDWRNTTKVPGWSSDFDAWAADALDRGDVDELARVRNTAPGMPYAHPTVEHFTPLFVTLGAAKGPRSTRADDRRIRPRPLQTLLPGRLISGLHRAGSVNDRVRAPSASRSAGRRRRNQEQRSAESGGR